MHVFLPRDQAEVFHPTDQDSLASLADQLGIGWEELARFNWGTDVPTEINWYLYNEVGCRRPNGDDDAFEPNANYWFRVEDAEFGSGTILLPKLFTATNLDMGRAHQVRVMRKGDPIDVKVKLIHDLSYPGASDDTLTLYSAWDEGQSFTQEVALGAASEQLWVSDDKRRIEVLFTEVPSYRTYTCWLDRGLDAAGQPSGGQQLFWNRFLEFKHHSETLGEES